MEIAVLQLALRSGNIRQSAHGTGAPGRSLPGAAHRTARGTRTELSLAHKRWSQGETGKTVLDGDVVRVEFSNDHADGITTEFYDSLALNLQPQGSLLALYQSWIDAVQALRAARGYRELLDPRFQGQGDGSCFGLARVRSKSNRGFPN